MAALFILALIVAVAKLWSDIRSLRLRVRALEWGGAPRPAAWPVPDYGYPAYAPPEPVVPYAQPYVPPEPWQAPVEPAAEPTAPLTTARVVYEAPPVETPPLRYPGPFDAAYGVAQDRLDPGPSFPSDDQGSGFPGQARDDEKIESPAGDTFEKNVPTPPTAQPTRALSFEDIFGRKLPIWAGGVTLAVCGFLIVKYSIEAGLISPLIRVIGGLFFGSGLIAGAEAARQNAERVRDPRVAQALSGAGVATLYATTLVAANLYHLIPPLAAFLFMAATTVLAGALSIRFGAPSAVLGLVGGLAAPALVGSGNPNVPLLAAYLSLAVGGLATLGRAQRWWWLGVAALAGGFGWGLVLILSGALSLADSLSVGGFLLLLGVGLPVLLFGGERGHLVRLFGTLIATAQLAALVATGGFTMLHWGLFGLLSAAAVWLSRREKPLADLPTPALLTALLLMAAWPQPTSHDLAIVFAGAAAIFGLPAAWRAWRPDWRLSDAGAVCVLAAAPLALALFHFNPSDRDATLLALLGAAAAGLVAALGWRAPERQGDTRFALLTGTAAILTGIAAPFALAPWQIAPAWALLAAALVMLGRWADDRRVEGIAWAAGAATLVMLILGHNGEALLRAGDILHATPQWRVLVEWAIPAAAALVFARFAKGIAAEPVASVAAVLLGYVALAQVVPPLWLPLIPAVAIAALGWARRSGAATLAAAGLALCWAAWPFFQWLALNGGALLGLWAHVGDLPTPAEMATRLLAPALAGGLVLWRHPPTVPRLREAGWVTVALLGTICAHIAWKQLFAISTADRFVALGLAERTIWEALLALVAVATWRRWPIVSRGFGYASLAHFTWFTLLLHDPLWARQAVGTLPVANLLLPAWGLGFALLWAAGRLQPPLPAIAERARGWAQMLLVLTLAAAELRQLVHGSILVGGGLGQAEDIARSIVAVGIAVGFLLWGIRRRNVDWRIASLVVMLGAVLKVFLLDVSGLDGLLRIASFAALGFSLIGIGWLYSRYLPDAQAPVNPSAAASA